MSGNPLRIGSRGEVGVDCLGHERYLLHRLCVPKPDDLAANHFALDPVSASRILHYFSEHDRFIPNAGSPRKGNSL
jgi:hypothetical protein